MLGAEVQTAISHSNSQILHGSLHISYDMKHSSPSGLPADILITIFSLFCSTKTFQDLIHVTHVCSHWRTVALDCPTLWGNPPMDNSSWTTEMFARSGDVSLRIDTLLDFAKDTVSKQKETLLTALQYIPRIHELSIALINADIDFDRVVRPFLEELFAALACPAPRLQVFRMDSDSFSGEVSLNNLFSRDAPHLRSLTLSGCVFPWNSPPLPLSQLTVFSLSSPFISEHISLDVMLNILKYTPRLEELNLRNVIAVPQVEENFESFSLPSRTALPHLRDLCIYAPLSVCATIFSSLVYPPTATLHARVPYPRFDYNASSIPVLLRELVASMYPGTIHSVYSMWVSRLDLKAWDGPGGRCFGRSPRPFISLKGPGHRPRTPFLTSLVDPLSLQNLVSLSVRYAVVSGDDWMAVLSQLHQLQILQVLGEEVGFLRAFCHGVINLDISFRTPQRLVLHRLQRLTLWGWKPKEDYGLPAAHLLKKCLMERRRRGCALRYLGIKHDDGGLFTDKDTSDLRTIVRTVAVC